MRKRLLILSAGIVLTAGVITYKAMDNTTPSQPITNTAATVVPKNTTTPDTITDNTPIPVPTSTATQTPQTDPTQTSTQSTSTPTPDQNRATLQNAVTQAATATWTALGRPSSQLNSFISVQWGCVDKMVSSQIGYNDYNAAASTAAAQTVLSSAVTNTDGSVVYRIYNDIGTCRISTLSPTS